VVKRVDAAELGIVIAVVLAAAAEAVLVAHRLSTPGAHLATALARLHVHSLARKKRSRGGDQHAAEIGLGGGTGNRAFR
jgi:hypothetical protein